jgi:hypothetical protein
VHEILSTEQPCILCAQPLEVVTITRDMDTGEERTERTRLDHNDVTCRETLALYREAFPWSSRT